MELLGLHSPGAVKELVEHRLVEAGLELMRRVAEALGDIANSYSSLVGVNVDQIGSFVAHRAIPPVEPG
jgi:hypothetical protein